MSLVSLRRARSLWVEKIRFSSTLGEWGAPSNSVTHHLISGEINAKCEVPRVELLCKSPRNPAEQIRRQNQMIEGLQKVNVGAPKYVHRGI